LPKVFQILGSDDAPIGLDAARLHHDHVNAEGSHQNKYHRTPSFQQFTPSSLYRKMRTIQEVRQQKRHLGKKVKDGHIFAKYGEFNITQERTRLIRFVPPLDGTILHFLS
jgi:hypothetical protein